MAGSNTRKPKNHPDEMVFKLSQARRFLIIDDVPPGEITEWMMAEKAVQHLIPLTVEYLVTFINRLGNENRRLLNLAPIKREFR